MAGYDDALPRECHWCGVTLNEGEVFVSQVEFESIVSGDNRLIEHNAVSGYAGLHAACDQCRKGMIENEECMTGELCETSGQMARVGKWYVRGFAVMTLIGMALAMGVNTDSAYILYIAAGVPMVAIPVGLIVMVIKAILRPDINSGD
jgi:hypothetical protein